MNSNVTVPRLQDCWRKSLLFAGEGADETVTGKIPVPVCFITV